MMSRYTHTMPLIFKRRDAAFNAATHAHHHHHNSSGSTNINAAYYHQIKLERVLGVTVGSNAALDCDPNTANVAYPAGCTVVFFNTSTAAQTHLINTNKKTITSLAYSPCGRYLVTGECGYQPAVRVWDLEADGTSTPQQISEFLGHKHGISCVAFSPTNKYVVSIGMQHDNIVNVWDWKNNRKAASNKVSTKIKAIAFAENGNYFVTVGNRLVKFWYLECGKNKYNKEAVPLLGRSAILGEQRNNYFCDVACGKAKCMDSTYAITRAGLLCEFNNRRLLDKWVELRTPRANCLCVSEQFIFVGCAEGIVRCFNTMSLNYVTTLPRPHYLGVDVSLGDNIQHMCKAPYDAKYPDCIAITMDELNNKLTCIYNDHSIYVWNLENIKRVGIAHSFLNHSACIWGVEIPPNNSPLPAGSFLTCSSDDTIRVWNLDDFPDDNSTMYRRNFYSNELLKTVYLDKELKFIKDLDSSGASSSSDRPESTYDGKNGIRSIRMSPDGKHLASGDREGNIRIHETSTMHQEQMIEAHDAEVLCLEFGNNYERGHRLLASASRDRLLHVFDVNQEFKVVQTLDDHSSSITAVRFLTASNGEFTMASCGADKTIMFRYLAEDDNNAILFSRVHLYQGKTTLYDMAVDASEKHILTACQDRNVRIYDVNTGKCSKSFKGSVGDEGSLIKMSLDKSGMYLATSCTDKSISVYDYYSNECMATVCGHSEVITCLRFTNDCRRLISVSGDGCIFVWRIPHDMVVTMHARLSQQAMRQGKTLDQVLAFHDEHNTTTTTTNVMMDTSVSSEMNVSDTQHYRFSVGQLPVWAQRHIGTDDAKTPKSGAKMTSGTAAASPKGRWAERAAHHNNPIFPLQPPHDADDESTMEMSFNESKTEKLTLNMSRITTRRPPPPLPDSSDIDKESNAHDGDIESDQECSSENLYYPAQIDSASGSEFTVTNIDANELRKSIRLSKALRLNQTFIAPTSPGTASQESEDDDDEENSTPSGENTDRNPLSMLSASSESLDQIVKRDQYHQSTFDTLSSSEKALRKSSLSSQYFTRSNTTTPRNIAVISAARQTTKALSTGKTRAELDKLIANARLTLRNIGYKHPLRQSQSIVDLSHIPEKENKWTSSKTGNQSALNAHLATTQATPPSHDYSTCSIISNNNQLNKNAAHANNNVRLFDDNTSSLLMPCSSASVPADLQLCGCYMREISKHTSDIQNLSFLKPSTITGSAKLSDITGDAVKSTTNTLIPARPRKLQLDNKTLGVKYKHKSLPVSPVSEECRLSDFGTRKSFSYFIDFDNPTMDNTNNTDDGFRKICDDIEKFSQDFSRNYQQIEDIFKEKSCFINSGQGFVKSQSDFTLKTTSNDDHVDDSKLMNYDAVIPDYANIQFYDPNDVVPAIIQNHDDDEDEMSSDSLEDCSFKSTRVKKQKKKNLPPPRRCVSNNELYKLQESIPSNQDYSKYYHHAYDCDMPKSESFYLNQSSRNSQESILSSEDCLLDDDFYRRSRSYCNSLESVLSNESDCKSAPLEMLFAAHSLPKSRSHFTELSTSNDSTSYSRSLESSSYHVEMRRSKSLYNKISLRTIQTQTDFVYETPEEKVVKKASQSTSSSSDFQAKLLKFESCIAQNEPISVSISKKQVPTKGIAFFVDTQQATKSADNNVMYIPSLASKNQQYKSKYCNVLNNKPEMNNLELFAQKASNKVSLNKNVNANSHSKKMNNKETASLDRHLLSSRSLLSNAEKVCHKPPKAVRRHSSKTRKKRTSYEYVKKEDLLNDAKRLNNQIDENSPPSNEKSIEFSYKENNVEKDLEASTTTFNNKKRKNRNIYNASMEEVNKVQCAIENIKILNEIQKKIQTINVLVDLFKKNLHVGKVRALSSMYESLNRNKKLLKDTENSQIQQVGQTTDEEHNLANDDSSLRRACSLSDLRVQIADSPKVKAPSNNSMQQQPGNNTPKSINTNNKSHQLHPSVRNLRANHRYSSPMMRSRSTGVLNHSDSDEPTDVLRDNNKSSASSRLMRPTISSQNKMMAKTAPSMRKKALHSQSVVNLNYASVEDSSSEDIDQQVNMPVAPPRVRLQHANNNSDNEHHHRQLNNVNTAARRTVTARSVHGARNVWNNEDNGGTTTINNDLSTDISTVQVSQELIDKLTMDLTSAANNVVKLYRRLTDPNDQASHVSHSSLLENLKSSIITTQKLLQDITLDELRRKNSNIDFLRQTDTVKNLTDLISKGTTHDPDTMVSIMQQYSDILLVLMQDKIQESA